MDNLSVAGQKDPLNGERLLAKASTAFTVQQIYNDLSCLICLYFLTCYVSFMKIKSLLLLMVFASQSLLGCHALSALNSKQNANDLNKGKDTCGRKYFEDFLNTPFDDINSQGDFSVEYNQLDDGSGVWKRKNRTYFLRVFDPRTLLPGEDMVVLANYSPKRLNVSLTDDGIIEELSCG